MEPLDRLIHSLTGEEKQEFQQEMLVNNAAEREQDFFRLVSDGHAVTHAKLKEWGFDPDHADPYHSFRKRLHRKLSDFIAVRKFRLDDSPMNKAIKHLYAAMHALSRNNPQECLKALQKAERLAAPAGLLTIREAIVNFKMENALWLKEDVNMLMAQSEEVRKLQDRSRQLNAHYATVVRSMEVQRQSGQPVDFQGVAKSIFLSDAVRMYGMNDAEFMSRLVSLARSKCGYTKQYDQFGEYLDKVFTHLEEIDAFANGRELTKANLLYMSAHANYRLWKFDRTRQYLNELYQTFPEDRPHLHPQFIAWAMMSAAVLNYEGKATEAIEMLNQIIDEHQMHFTLAQVVKIKLNLSVYYFCLGEYRKSQQIMSQINLPGSWLDDQISREWRMKKEMIEVIFLYELGHIDLAASRIKSIRSTFDDLFAQEVYKRAYTFLGFILRLIDNPDIARTKEFAVEVKSSGMRSPGITEDVQAITFFCWLRSKMERRPYYEVLQEWVMNAKGS